MGDLIWICESCGKARATVVVSFDPPGKQDFHVCARCELQKHWGED